MELMSEGRRAARPTAVVEGAARWPARMLSTLGFVPDGHRAGWRPTGGRVADMRPGQSAYVSPWALASAAQGQFCLLSRNARTYTFDRSGPYVLVECRRDGAFAITMPWHAHHIRRLDLARAAGFTLVAELYEQSHSGRDRHRLYVDPLSFQCL